MTVLAVIVVSLYIIFFVPGAAATAFASRHEADEINNLPD